MDSQILEDVGLTKAEIKLYISIVESVSITATELAATTGLQSSVVYATLPKLLNKGFINYIKKGRAKYYGAADPKALLDYIDEKRSRLESFLPLLLAKKRDCKQEAEVYLGFKGWKNMLYTLIRDAKPGDEYLFINFHSDSPERYEKQYLFYKHFEKERKSRGIIIKGIANENVKEFFKGRDTKNVKFTSFPFPANITIFQDKITIEPMWEGEQIAFLLSSKELAQGFRKYWYAMWDLVD